MKSKTGCASTSSLMRACVCSGVSWTKSSSDIWSDDDDDKVWLRAILPWLDGAKAAVVAKDAASRRVMDLRYIMFFESCG